jgi:hypothetical protein
MNTTRPADFPALPIDEFSDELSLTSAHLPEGDASCPECRGARWLVVRGPAEGQPARNALAVEVHLAVIAPCGVCRLAIH